MKLLSDNTADRLLRHLNAVEGGITPRRIPRGASTTPPAPMWQIHVVPSTGVVTVDGGDVYADGTRYTLANSSPGTATGDTLVVWSYDSDGPAGGTISLMSSVSSLGYPFRVLGAINENDSVYTSEQYCSNPIEIGGGAAPGPDASGTAIAKVLGGTDYNAAEDTWEYGETAEVPVDPEDPEGDTVAKPTYPVYNPTRLYWQESVHTLWMFRRTETYNSSGLLVAVSAEVRTAVFTTVAEMP